MNPKFNLSILDLLTALLAVGMLIFALLYKNGSQLHIIIPAIIFFILAFAKLLLLSAYETVLPSPLSIEDSVTELTFQDADGRLAKAKKVQRIIPNQPDIKIMLDHGLNADGEIRITHASCNEVGTSKQLEVSTEPEGLLEKGNDTLRFIFKNDLRKGKKYDRILELDFTNSFLKSKEYFSIRVSRRLKRLTLIINSPLREISRTWLKYIDESTIVETDSPNIRLDKENTMIRYQVNRPKPGSIHQIWWEW